MGTPKCFNIRKKLLKLLQYGSIMVQPFVYRYFKCIHRIKLKSSTLTFDGSVFFLPIPNNAVNSFKSHLTYCRRRFERNRTLNRFRLGRCDSDISWLRRRTAGFRCMRPLPIWISIVADTIKSTIFFISHSQINVFVIIKVTNVTLLQFFFLLLFYLKIRTFTLLFLQTSNPSSQSSGYPSSA